MHITDIYNHVPGVILVYRKKLFTWRAKTVGCWDTFHFKIFCHFKCYKPCTDPGIFVRGGPSQSDKKKKLWRFFFFFFLVLSLFYRSQMVNFKEIYHFSRFQRGSNIFQGGGGGVQLFQGGSYCLFPYNLWFSRGGGGGVRNPPSGSALALNNISIILSFISELGNWRTAVTFRVSLFYCLLKYSNK